MMAPQGSSLQHKVMLVVLTTTCVALLLSATALLIYELRSYRESWISDLETQAELVALASAPALSFNDPKAATENLSLLRLRPQITAAAVYDARGELFATYRDTASLEKLLPSHAGTHGHVLKGERLELYRPIRENDDLLGTVYLRATHDIGGRLFDYLLILLSVMATSLLVAALVSRRLQHTLTAPILDVAQVARDVMHKRDFSLRAPKTSDDEVGVLVDAFNAMLTEVDKRTEELQRANDNLSVEMAERRKAEQALTQAARVKDQFLATLAHELRNPLAPITNAVELLRRSGEGDSGVNKRALEIVGRQVRQMVRLIDDLLDVSRITTGKLLLRKQRVDLMTVLNSALEIASPSIEARGHRLSLELPEGPVFIEADATRLAQVFANLLNNAAKYTGDGGRIGLKLERAQDGLIVRVADSGVGIAPDNQSSIFDMFVQVDQSLESGQAGLGVGLTLARQLIEMHGGRIGVSSAGLGRGSEFTVWLPAGDVLPATPVQAQAHPPASTAWRRILVADDNVDFASSLCSLLESLGHAVTVANDGQKAFELATSLRPDFVFLDIGMPGLNGYELAQRLRASPGMRHSVIVATDWGQEQDRARVRASGFDHHLVKPVDVGRLMTILSTGMAAPAAPEPA